MDDKRAMQFINSTEAAAVILEKLNSEELQKAIATCDFKDKMDFTRGVMFGMTMASLFINIYCTKYTAQVPNIHDEKVEPDPADKAEEGESGKDP